MRLSTEVATITVMKIMFPYIFSVTNIRKKPLDKKEIFTYEKMRETVAKNGTIEDVEKALRPLGICFDSPFEDDPDYLLEAVNYLEKIIRAYADRIEFLFDEFLEDLDENNHDFVVELESVGEALGFLALFDEQWLKQYAESRDYSYSPNLAYGETFYLYIPLFNELLRIYKKKNIKKLRRLQIWTANGVDITVLVEDIDHLDGFFAASNEAKRILCDVYLGHYATESIHRSKFYAE